MHNVRVGQTVAFKYDGGTNPGANRLVSIEKVDANHIKGRDLDEFAFRSFRKDRIAGNSVTVVADEGEELVRLSNIVSVCIGDISEEQAVQVYKILQPKRKVLRAYLTDNHKFIVVSRSTTPSVEVSVDKSSTTITFVNGEGRRLKLRLDHETSLPDNFKDFSVACPLTPDVIRAYAKELTTHAGSGSDNVLFGRSCVKAQ